MHITTLRFVLLAVVAVVAAFVGGLLIWSDCVEVRNEMQRSLNYAIAVAESPAWDCPPEGFSFRRHEDGIPVFLQCRLIDGEWEVRVEWVLRDLEAPSDVSRAVAPSEMPLIARFWMDPLTREVFAQEIRWNLRTVFLEGIPWGA